MKKIVFKILRFIKNFAKLIIPPIVWFVVIGCGAWLLRKLAELIEKYPIRAMIAFGIILLLTNIFNYMGMKAKVSSAEWRYDTLQLHTDSLEEIYNVNKNYSRITSYE